jgi:hypothetical protein
MVCHLMMCREPGTIIENENISALKQKKANQGQLSFTEVLTSLSRVTLEVSWDRAPLSPRLL